MPAEVIQPQPITIPSLGDSYTDPMSGLRITRVADTASTEYSSVCPFSIDGKWALLITGERRDRFALYDVANAGASVRELPGVTASSEPRFSTIDPSLFYFHDATGPLSGELCTYNITTGEVRVIHDFSEPFTFGKGEGSIDATGDYLPIVTPTKVLIYRISTDRESTELPLGGRTPESMYLTPENPPGALISWE